MGLSMDQKQQIVQNRRTLLLSMQQVRRETRNAARVACMCTFLLLCTLLSYLPALCVPHHASALTTSAGVLRVQILRTRDSVIAVLQQGLPAKYDDITASQEFIKVFCTAPDTLMSLDLTAA